MSQKRTHLTGRVSSSAVPPEPDRTRPRWWLAGASTPSSAARRRPSRWCGEGAHRKPAPHHFSPPPTLNLPGQQLKAGGPGLLTAVVSRRPCCRSLPQLKEWVSTVASAAGTPAADARLATGQIGARESLLELELMFTSLSVRSARRPPAHAHAPARPPPLLFPIARSRQLAPSRFPARRDAAARSARHRLLLQDLEAFFASLPGAEHVAWLRRLAPNVVDTTPRWEVLRSLDLSLQAGAAAPTGARASAVCALPAVAIRALRCPAPPPAVDAVGCDGACALT